MRLDFRTKVLYHRVMNFLIRPDAIGKLERLGNVTQDEAAGDSPQTEVASDLPCISHVTTPQGKKPILKAMMTTACERNCHYCVFRAGRSKTERVSFTPDEMAKSFDTLNRSKQADGMFLSSGIIKGSVTTQDKILDTAEIIRGKYHYKGYLHLKIMPGAEHDQLFRAMQLADRVSINLEGPTQERLNRLAPKKDFFNELFGVLAAASQIRRNNPGQKLASLVTQFVVGAVEDTDLEVLSMSERLYQQLGLTRAYYSGFHPVSQTPFEELPASDKQRILRLYQASFLLRDYGWSSEELPYLPVGNLPIEHDPKVLWADLNLRHSPIDLMTAERDDLMRVPGIGRKGAEAILRVRRNAHLTDLSQLRKLGIRAPERTAPYVLLNGRRQPTQLSLF
jgi:predicted DNA-binding helix-hairpin-helix protein